MLTLAWTRAVGSVTGYLVWVDGSLTRMTTGTEVTITGLSNGREYRLAVSAVGPGGESPRSTDVFVTPRNSRLQRQHTVDRRATRVPQ